MTGGLRHPGPVSTGWLRHVGIQNLDDPSAVWLFWGLAGAACDIDWRL